MTRASPKRPAFGRSGAAVLRAVGKADEVTFQTKPEMGREQIRPALASDLPRGVVLADAGYGMDTRFREGLSELG